MRGALVTLVTLSVMVGTVACGAGGRDRSPAATAINVSRSDCGSGWIRPTPGDQTFEVHNSGSTAAEVEVIDPGSGAVFGELEGLGPDTTRSLHVVLGQGTYAFRCATEQGDPVVGPSVRINGGPQRGTPAVVPVTANDLLDPLKQYQSYVQNGLDELVTRTSELQDAVHSGDLGAARSAWLPAHLTYERLGAAYDAFGEVDKKINGRPDRLPGGVQDADFGGFHRVEYGLWHGESASSLTPSVDSLAQDVRELRAAFRTMEIDPNALGLRAHEILEGTLQFGLTGKADQGSGTELATASANLDGTWELLTVLRPLLLPRYPAMSEVDKDMTRVRDLVDSAHRPDGGWVSVAALPTTRREQLDGAIGELLERLAPVADICEPRRTS